MQRHHYANKSNSTVKVMVFPLVMYGCESWTIKKAEHQRIDTFKLWCWRRFSTVPCTTRRSNQSILKEINWIFIARTDAEGEVPILWPPDAKSWVTRKDPDAGKDWRQESKGTTEDEMVGWHHRLDEHEFEQIPGDSEEQRNLVCCSPWGHQESDMTYWVKNKTKNLQLSGIRTSRNANFGKVE